MPIRDRGRAVRPFEIEGSHGVASLRRGAPSSPPLGCGETPSPLHVRCSPLSLVVADCTPYLCFGSRGFRAEEQPTGQCECSDTLLQGGFNTCSQAVRLFRHPDRCVVGTASSEQFGTYLKAEELRLHVTPTS